MEATVEDSQKPVWYVYLIETHCGMLYTGSTTDPKRRFRQHCGVLQGGAKFLKARKPHTFRAIFKLSDKSTALKLEWRIKRLSRSQKLSLLTSHRLDEVQLVCALDAVQSDNSST
ncbi:GIY-YIG nuclease family protein [Alteromonas ponticola]|uniref:GIY-YIG nuclease family protein n=1 Tax=Alteromonas aquimaris TaxID=2998417 RepID=A0ABT3P396_9ALTE|nr:GIY-YIG nuclease family protein [Alteromonas aquimaris]MCW8107239.1 GIY-YIG nuclease family protein [Alteromonas aquimaris]